MSKKENYDEFGFRIFYPLLDTKIDDIEKKILSPLSCIRELDSEWILEFDLPLVNKKDISITLSSENSITVEAKLRETYFDSELDYTHEFKYFKKTLSLPGKINKNKITTNFTNGRLIIQIPKVVQRNKIKIE